MCASTWGQPRWKRHSDPGLAPTWSKVTSCARPEEAAIQIGAAPSSSGRFTLAPSSANASTTGRCPAWPGCGRVHQSLMWVGLTRGQLGIGIGGRVSQSVELAGFARRSSRQYTNKHGSFGTHSRLCTYMRPTVAWRGICPPHLRRLLPRRASQPPRRGPAEPPDTGCWRRWARAPHGGRSRAPCSVSAASPHCLRTPRRARPRSRWRGRPRWAQRRPRWLPGSPQNRLSEYTPVGAWWPPPCSAHPAPPSFATGRPWWCGRRRPTAGRVDHCEFVMHTCAKLLAGLYPALAVYNAGDLITRTRDVYTTLNVQLQACAQCPVSPCHRANSLVRARPHLPWSRTGVGHIPCLEDRQHRHAALHEPAAHIVKPARDGGGARLARVGTHSPRPSLSTLKLTCRCSH